MKNEKEARIFWARDISLSDLPEFHFIRPDKRTIRGKRDIMYAREICSFDIETSTLQSINQSFMYVWQFAIEDVVYMGRTWEEFKRFLSLLRIVSNGYRLLCFVHNLSYEFQFLSGIFHFDNDSVFCVESRKILYCVLNNWLEFRCSYFLSNMSLAEMTTKYGVAHQKRSGEDFNYDKLRYPWTDLTEKEIEYCTYDVLGVVESVHAIMNLHGDNVYTLPLTSTGYVRRDVKREMAVYHTKIDEIFPSYDVYKLLRAEFRGGNTHANRYYAGEVIRENGESADIASSYPAQQCNNPFPVTPFKKIVNPSTRLIERLREHGRALLLHCIFEGIELRDRYYPVPYIPTAKCVKYENAKRDNGRIINASYVEIVLNDIDFNIVEYQYKWNRLTIIEGYKSTYGALPDGIRKCNIEYFKNKTELKNVESQELYYMKAKNLLNSVYGLSCQLVTKPLILFNDCLYEYDETYTEEQLLIRARKRAYTVYQFACWTTAHARAALEEGIKLCGERLLYVDTDSCKYLGHVDFSKYNEEQKQKAIRSGLYATDKKGVTHYGGVYEFDGCFSAFCTQGAKKYCYIDEKGKLHLTVSGVGKKRGAAALEAAGGIEAFKPNFVFHNCGKTASVYNDCNYGEIEIDGHTLNITRNVVIQDKDYTLDITEDYESLIKESKQFLYKMKRLLESTKL